MPNVQIRRPLHPISTNTCPKPPMAPSPGGVTLQIALNAIDTPLLAKDLEIEHSTVVRVLRGAADQLQSELQSHTEKASNSQRKSSNSPKETRHRGLASAVLGNIRWPASIPAHTLLLQREVFKLYQLTPTSDEEHNLLVSMEDYAQLSHGIDTLHMKVVGIYQNLVEKLPPADRREYELEGWLGKSASKVHDSVGITNGASGEKRGKKRKSDEMKMNDGPPNPPVKEPSQRTHHDTTTSSKHSARPPKNYATTPHPVSVPPYLDPLQWSPNPWEIGPPAWEVPNGLPTGYPFHDHYPMHPAENVFSWPPPQARDLAPGIHSHHPAHDHTPRPKPPPARRGRPPKNKDILPPTMPLENPLDPVGSGMKEKKTKRKYKYDKDPNKPKRGRTSFILWANSVRPKIQEENPGIGFSK